LEPGLSYNIKLALKVARGIEELYIHQVAAIDALSQHRHVIVSTSTASGKSVIYQVGMMIGSPFSPCLNQPQVPLLRFLESDPNSTAIFVYPTKVLFTSIHARLITDGRRLLLKISAAHSSSC
jgi:DEAD/DEAH box helicase domain-containing protein